MRAFSGLYGNALIFIAYNGISLTGPEYAKSAFQGLSLVPR